MDKSKLDRAWNTTVEWGYRHEAAAEVDHKQGMKDLAHAYSTWKVAEYASFGQTFKPMAEF